MQGDQVASRTGRNRAIIVRNLLWFGAPLMVVSYFSTRIVDKYPWYYALSWVAVLLSISAITIWIGTKLGSQVQIARIGYIRDALWFGAGFVVIDFIAKAVVEKFPWYVNVSMIAAVLAVIGIGAWTGRDSVAKT